MGKLFDMAVRGEKAVHAHCAVLNHPFAIEPRCEVDGRPGGFSAGPVPSGLIKPDAVVLRPGFASVRRERDAFVTEEWAFTCDLKIAHNSAVTRPFAAEWTGLMRLSPVATKPGKWNSASVVELSPDLYIVMYADLNVSVQLYLEVIT